MNNQINLKTDTSWKDKIASIKKSKLWARDMAVVAVRVLDYLEKNNKSQKWLADQLGVSPQQVTQIVKGQQNMSWGKIKELEAILGLSLVELVRQESIARVHTINR